MAILESVLVKRNLEGKRTTLSVAPILSVMTPFLVAIALPAFLLIGWELAVKYGFIGGRLMPPPSKILATVSALFASGELVTHIRVTLGRVVAGFTIGALAGTVIGGLTGAVPAVARIFDPTLQALRAIPSIAWVPLFILWFGIFEASKIALIAVGVFFPVYLGVYGAIIGVDRKIVEVGRIFRLTRLQLARRILLPSILPSYILALRAGLGLGWMFVVAAEFMGASEGIGYLLVDGQQLGKPDQIIGSILIFALIGKITDSILLLITSPLLAWQDNHRENR